MKKSLIILVVFCSALSYGQFRYADQLLNNFNDFSIINTNSLASINLAPKDILGSSYINENFLSANISNQETVYSMRYNVYRDEMEIELDGKAYYLPKTSYYTIKFNVIDKVYRVFDFKENDVLEKGFFKVLNVGEKMPLLIKEKIKLYEEVPAKLGFTRYEPPKLGRSKDIMYVGINYEAVELPKKKKDILELFSPKDGEIDSFAKKNKLSFKNTEDLIKIFSYYNSL